jgi:adenylate kinase
VTTPVGIRLLLLGAPGSGKGTQGQRLADHYDVAHISSGDLLRAASQDSSGAGAELRGYLDRGELVPDDVVLRIVGPHALEASRSGGYVLDGFPRTAAQAEYARTVAKDANVEVQAAVFLDVPEDELVDRLLQRGREQGRTDDNADVVLRRLEVFEAHNTELVRFYEQLGILVSVDATGAVDDVSAAILAGLQGRGF